MASKATPSKSQLSKTLPEVTSYLTGHDSSGKAIVESDRPGKWQAYEDNTMAFNVVYTTSSFPPDLNSSSDIKQHDTLMSSGKLGLVNPGGTVCRMVDFSPGYECMMHRTQSLDYGIVLEGSVKLLLDSGEERLMKRGDVCVQRATMHAWREATGTEWARMIFVLQDCKPLVVGGQHFKEDLGRGVEGLPKSGND